MTVRHNLLALLAILALGASSAFAETGVDPDPDLWSGDTGVNGEELVPVVAYDPMEGWLKVDLRGLNGMVDTNSGAMIEGDDIGMISLSVEGPEPDAFPLSGFINGVVWNGQYFNGKAQVFGVGAGAEYMLPSDDCVTVFTYPTGLTADDFGVVEMAANFSPGVPGGILFGSVQIVPEPSTISLFSVAMLGMLGFIRRR
ncbi:MAG: PEP-CTERM sorting domain-containing protein [Planctomycetota bacterium]